MCRKPVGDGAKRTRGIKFKNTESRSQNSEGGRRQKAEGSEREAYAVAGVVVLVRRRLEISHRTNFVVPIMQRQPKAKVTGANHMPSNSVSPPPCGRNIMPNP